MSVTRVLFQIAWAAYLLAALLFSLYYANRKMGFRYGAISSLIIAALSQTLFEGWRWVEGSRPPFANTFETLVFFSLAVAVSCIVVELLYSPKAVGAAGSLFALLMLAYANLFDWAIEPLMPALQNNFWLTLHVLFCFISYASFALSYVVALVFLLRHGGAWRKVSAFVSSLSAVGILGGLLYGWGRGKGVVSRMDGSTLLAIIGGSVFIAAAISVALVQVLKARNVRPVAADSPLSNLVLKTVAFGFPFLTLGIITGAVWANIAWGRYWGWDPKETWSLITWVVYAVFLHVRFAGGWLGLKPKSLPQLQAILSVVGFLFVVFTWFGVNYLLAGLHAYA